MEFGFIIIVYLMIVFIGFFISDISDYLKNKIKKKRKREIEENEAIDQIHLVERTIELIDKMIYLEELKKINEKSDNILQDNTLKITTKEIKSYIKPKHKIVTGDKIILDETNIYEDSILLYSTTKLSGVFYLWDNRIINNRIKITDSKNRVGIADQVTGWVDYNDIIFID